MQKKTKEYSEIELIKMFGLSRFTGNNASPLMIKWTDTDTKLSVSEQEIFDFIYGNMVKNIVGWQEEDLKMQFISFVLYLGHLQSTDKYLNFYEKTIDATVEGHYLKTKTDFMIANGTIGIPEAPYFHFQEYKPFKNPSGDSMGQLLEAFLIAQHKNNNKKQVARRKRRKAGSVNFLITLNYIKMGPITRIFVLFR